MIRLHTLCPACKRRLCSNAGWTYCEHCKEKTMPRNPSQQAFKPTVAGQVTQEDYSRLQERIKAAGWSVSRFVGAAVKSALDALDAEEKFARYMETDAAYIPILAAKAIQSEAFPIRGTAGPMETANDKPRPETILIR